MFRADCTVHLDSGAVLKSEGKQADAHRAFDAALEHMEKQVRRYKRRLKNHHEKARPQNGERSESTRKVIMEISDLLAPEAVVPALKAQSKKQLLQELAERAARLTGLPERRIFETLIERERLGTTGMGQGIAIPHGRLAGLTEDRRLFARLEKPIEYEAVDEQPVDLVFLLLAPEGAGADHSEGAGARVAPAAQSATCEKLRAATKPEVLFALLTEPTAGPSSQAA